MSLLLYFLVALGIRECPCGNQDGNMAKECGWWVSKNHQKGGVGETDVNCHFCQMLFYIKIFMSTSTKNCPKIYYQREIIKKMAGDGIAFR